MNWHPSKFLMPLAFACILGGMNTLIGTPPNLIISDIRLELAGSSFGFFDFSFVGIAITVFGILFIAFIGKKFILLRQTSANTPLINLKGYLFEVVVDKGSSAIGLTLYKFKKRREKKSKFLVLFLKKEQ